MKRDWDMIRRILLALEETPAGRGQNFIYNRRLLSVDDAVLKGHILLAKDERLAEIELLELLNEWGVNRARLLPRGHDFLEAVRTQARLKKVLAWIIAMGREVTVQLILEGARVAVSSE